MTCNPDYYIDKVSESALDTSFTDIDKVTLQNAKYRILDLLGCTLSGAMGAGNEGFVNLVRSWGGKEESTIFVLGGKVPAHNAAMVNSVLARTYDFEAVAAFVEGVDLASHISVTTVLTALAMGEAHNISGKELLTSLLVGDDIASRILGASGFGGGDGKNFALGWDGNGTVNAFGATAIAGRMLGLTKKQLKCAFGIVLNQMGGSFQNIWDGSLCFKLPNALSARNGIFSAELAKAGWDGVNDPLFSRFGYFNLFTGGCSDSEILTKDIGKVFYTEATFKPYPCCRANHAAVDCALNIIRENEIEASTIKDIVVRVPPRVRDMFVGQPFILRETPQIDAAFSLRFSVANVLLRKRIKLEDFQEELIREEGIADIAAKIRIEGFAPNELGQKAAALTITLKDGRECYSEVKYVKGGPFENSLTDKEIKDKFRLNLLDSKSISEESGERIIDLVDNIEEVDNIAELTKLLV